MKFSEGDKVLLKRTKEEGIILWRISNDVLEVLVGGVSFPVYEDEVEHPYLYWFTEKSKKRKTKTVAEEIAPELKPERRAVSGMYLLLLPKYVHNWQEEEIELFNVHLLNETNEIITVSYSCASAEQEFSLPLKLHPFQNIFVHQIAFPDFADSPVWQISIHSEEQKLKPYQNRLRPKKAMDLIHHMRVNQLPSIRLEIPLENLELPKPIALPIIKPTWKPSKTLAELKSSTAHVFIPDFIDLHAEKLLKNTKALSHSEILQLQLHACRNYIQDALQHRLTAVTVVHGLGKGVLKASIHDMLKSWRQVQRFDNDWDGRFGFGATHIYF